MLKSSFPSTQSSQGGGNSMPHRATWRSTKLSWETEGVRRNHGQEILLWFPWEELVRKGKKLENWLVWIISASLEAEGLVPSRLVPGPGQECSGPCVGVQ